MEWSGWYKYNGWLKQRRGFTFPMKTLSHFCCTTTDTLLPYTGRQAGSTDQRERESRMDSLLAGKDGSIKSRNSQQVTYYCLLIIYWPWMDICLCHGHGEIGFSARNHPSFSLLLFFLPYGILSNPNDVINLGRHQILGAWNESRKIYLTIIWILFFLYFLL